MSRAVRGRHRSLRVFGQRAGAPTITADPFVQPHVTPDQPDRRRLQSSASAASSKSFGFFTFSSCHMLLTVPNL